MSGHRADSWTGPCKRGAGGRSDFVFRATERTAAQVTKSPNCWRKRLNEVWSWAISKIIGPAKWSYRYVCVIFDIYSRRVVCWHVDYAESAALFKPLLKDAMEKQEVPPDQ